MTSEIRANKQTNRVGLGTVEYTNTGIIVSGIVTCTELSGLTALNIAGVGTASTLDINGDIDVDGHTNLDNLSVAGVSTFTGNADFSSGVDVTGTITGNNLTLSDNDPELTFTDLNNNPDYRIKAESGNLSFEDTTNGNVARLRINANGHVDVTDNLDVSGDLDVDGHTNLDNVSVAGVSTFTGNIKQTAPGTNTAKITLNNASDTTGMDVGYSEGSGVGFINVGQSGSGLSIKTGGTAAGNERLLITSGGQVQIPGGTTPFHVTHTGGDCAQFHRGSKYLGINADWGGNTGDSVITASTNLVIHTNGSNERVRITSDGRMGINTNSPTAKLNIKDTSNNGAISQLLKLGNDSSGAGTGAGIQLGAGSGNAGNSVLLSGFYDGTGTSFTVSTCASYNGAQTERLRIRSNGQLVVNHTQSSTPLNNTFLSIYDANSDSSAIDASGISKNYAMISLHNYGTGNNGDTTGIGFGAGSGFSYTKGSVAFQRSGSYGTGDLVFLTNNDQNTTMVNDTDERMRIRKDGAIVVPNGTLGLRFGGTINAGTEDFAIFHSGNNSHIDHFGTGNLYQDFNNDFHMRFYRSAGDVRTALTITNGVAANPTFTIQSNPTSASVNSGTHAPLVKFKGAGWNTNSGSVEVGTQLQSEHHYWSGSYSNTFGQTYPDFKIAMKNSDSNSYVEKFAFSGNGVMRLQSGGGINFHNYGGGGGVSSNTLDDYEEGDHDTTITMSGDTSFSYSSRTLAYTKIGRAVFVTGRINMTGAGGSSFRFTLPFTCGDGSFKYETSNEFQNIRFNDGYTFRIRSNTAYADLQSDGSDTGIGTGNPHINVNIFYFTA